MATKAQVLARLKKIPDDEPLFLLEGHDRLAPGLVRYWSGAARARGARESKVKEALECADAMERYPRRKYPD
jgi:hypothetical protein